MTASRARRLWKALVDNASRLIADAHALLEDSPGRARSLTVLAQEELGKALWIYDEFHVAWNSGVDEERTVEALQRHGRDHTRKYFEAVVFGDTLAKFWGDYSNLPRPAEGESWEQFAGRRLDDTESAAKAANLAKQRGFYVDVDAAGVISCPADVDPGDVGEDLERAAQVIEMLLIRDHSRMKFESKVAYDSTLDQQFRLLPVSHPKEFGDWLARGGDPIDADGDPEDDADDDGT